MRKLLLLFLTVSLLLGDTYVFVDLSKGMSLKSYNELGKLTMIKSGKTIYKNREKVYLFAFKGTSVMKAEPFIYYEKRVAEAKYKKGRKKHLSFFKKLKKAIKPPRKKQINANVVFVVDTSGSMVSKHNNYLREVKDAMKTLIKHKSKKAKISIVTFDGKANMPTSKRSHIVADNLKSKRELLDAIESIKVSRYDTFLGSGLDKAASLLPKRSKKKSVIMIFTDGNKINDYKDAKEKVESLKQKGIEVKVVAIGGADVSMLKNFSTSGYVYNATTNDLQGIVEAISITSDEIILRLNTFLNTKKLSKDDKIIIYSSMQNVDSISDFTLIPNLGDKNFYKEFEQQNRQRGIDFDFNKAKVYVRIVGNPGAEETQKLSIFWKRFFKEHHADLRYFEDAKLTKSEIE